MSCSGHAGVCFKPPTGQGFEDMQAEVMSLLSMDGTGGLRKAQDSFGYHWLVVEDPDIEAAGHPDPPGQLVAVRRRLGTPAAVLRVRPGRLPAAGTGRRRAPTTPVARRPTPSRRPGGDVGRPGTLLASSAYLVYLFKRGTFYPFVPDGNEQRDIEQEFKLRSLVADDLTVETDLDRWFPLWDLPVG